MKETEFAAAGWPIVIGLFVGILIYRLTVHQDFTDGIIVGLTAAILTFTVIRLIGGFRRRPK